MGAFRFPAKSFRSLPAPSGPSKYGLFFSPAKHISKDLLSWRDVNPREINRRSAVYKSIQTTLMQEPERFHERNRGITLVASGIEFDDKKQEVVIQLDDKKLHGVVDGAHTLDAIASVQGAPPDESWPASVFIKVVTGVDIDQIAEIAGGLNTSQQVDLKSLENLREHFDVLKKKLNGEPYADSIAYKMNEDKPVDVREVLYYLAMFDCSTYDDKRHPVALFGRKEGIVRRFAEQAANPSAGDSFKTLITQAPQILALRDLIEKKALEQNVGRYKTSKSSRVRSESNKGNKLVFLDETVDGKIPLGWIMPMLAAFRANVEWEKPKGSFTWKFPLDELVEESIEQLVLGIQDVHEQENSRPEYVGRNSLSWRLSYNTVAQCILQKELASARRKSR